MNRIDRMFEASRAARTTVLMPFITAGDPDLEVTAALLPALADAGAGAAEIGFPFSDPIADGPVIAASMHRALQGGTTPEAIFEMIDRVRPTTDLGLIAMVSASIVERMGAAAFMSRAAEVGVDGVIVPDLDDLDAETFAREAADRDLAFSMLVAPTTPPKRVAWITGLCRGFVYLLARAGITGERDAAPDIEASVRMIRKSSRLPIAVGFGISRPEHVAAVARHAEAAIVGSALVRRIGESQDPVGDARRFVTDLARGLAAAPAD